mmetsp:Transcript_33406/g.73664  ORF Transcript_33406/g.73664 Transcript_33406/m.73664 type:complete len:91 (-) Transcript_33406:134-406(-)
MSFALHTTTSLDSSQLLACLSASLFYQLLGINVFTYILGAAIVFFLTMNAVLGPGWLGQVTGVPGTGTFTEVSESLPNNMDLNNPENLLN